MLLQIGSDLLIHMGHPEEAFPGLYSLRNSSAKHKHNEHVQWHIVHVCC